jgi:uroporphyrinogen decarboxylase
MLRNWFGTERLSYLWHDDPGLIEDALECLTEFALATFAPALESLRFDFYYIHEDMAGRSGPLIGPSLFRRFLLPHYRRLVGLLRSSGVAVILVDTDGDFEALLPIFLEAGVDGFGPMEVAAGMDPVRMRREYGTSFCMVGGVDKREIAQGRAAIDGQIDRVVRPLLETGGFIPTIDHSVPPDVSYSDFLYYLDRKREAVFGCA